jgi:beta-galactosidase
VGKNGRADIVSCELSTTGPPARIKMTPDRSSLSPDGIDLSHVEISVVDAEGKLVYEADNQIEFELTGPGRIIAVDSGDIRSHESFQVPARKAYHGKCLAIMQSTTKSGRIRLRASFPGLIEDEITFTASAVARR